MGCHGLKESILEGKLSEPVIFEQMISDWPAAAWSLSSLAAELGDKKLKFRVGQLRLQDVQWETKCQYVDATLSEFQQWTEGTCAETNVLYQYSRSTHWLYADYKYMKEVFEDHPELLRGVDWSTFGFADRDGRESTIWLGSPGAYTVGHYDTYGCNLVAQIYGRKRWVLFPPDEGDLLYPTRVPYEESSVFSKVNIRSPDLDLYPKVKQSTPYVVTMEPGQVLFVPRHWWHFVENLENSCSINSWIELNADKGERVKEAIVRFLAFSVMSDGCDDESWLNPTEVTSSGQTNMMYLSRALAAMRPCKGRPEVTPPPSATFDLLPRDEPQRDPVTGGSGVQGQAINNSADLPKKSPVRCRCHVAQTAQYRVESDSKSVAGSEAKRRRHDTSCRAHFMSLSGGGEAYKINPVEFSRYLGDLTCIQPPQAGDSPDKSAEYVRAPETEVDSRNTDQSQLKLVPEQTAESQSREESGSLEREPQGKDFMDSGGESDSSNDTPVSFDQIPREILLDSILNPAVISLITANLLNECNIK